MAFFSFVEEFGGLEDPYVWYRNGSAAFTWGKPAADQDLDLDLDLNRKRATAAPLSGPPADVPRSYLAPSVPVVHRTFPGLHPRDEEIWPEGKVEGLLASATAIAAPPPSKDHQRHHQGLYLMQLLQRRPRPRPAGQTGDKTARAAHRRRSSSVTHGPPSSLTGGARDTLSGGRALPRRSGSLTCLADLSVGSLGSGSGIDAGLIRAQARALAEVLSWDEGVGAEEVEAAGALLAVQVKDTQGGRTSLVEDDFG